MSKKLVAAYFAVLSLSACEEAQPQPPPQPPVTSRQKSTIAQPAPIAVEAKRDAGPSVTVATAGAGFDSLSLSHDTPTVDHLARARQLRRDGDRRGALTEARRALFTAPDDEEALTLTARLARQVGQPELAAQALGRLASLRTDDATPLIAQARALLQAKDYPGAVMAGREAIARDDGNAEAHHLVGLSQLAMGELTGAISSFRRAVELEPGHGWALNNLGLAYLRANQNQAAVEVLEPSAELLPHVAFVHNNLGVALERVGRKEEAKAAYLHAMDLSPRYVKARVNVERMARAQVSDDEVELELPAEAPHPQPEPLTPAQ